MQLVISKTTLGPRDLSSSGWGLDQIDFKIPTLISKKHNHFNVVSLFWETIWWGFLRFTDGYFWLATQKRRIYLPVFVDFKDRFRLLFTKTSKSHDLFRLQGWQKTLLSRCGKSKCFVKGEHIRSLFWFKDLEAIHRDMKQLLIEIFQRDFCSKMYYYKHVSKKSHAPQKNLENP